MTATEKRKIAEAVREALKQETFTQASLQRKSGVNNRYIQAIKDGQDFTTQREGGKEDRRIPIKDEYYIKLGEVLGVFDKEFHFETVNYDKIRERCDYAMQTKRRVLIDSRESGAGKTYTLQKYAKDHPDTALYTKGTSLMKGKDLVEDLLDQLNITIEGRVSNTNKLRMIADKVLSRQVEIIIDEMESVSPDMWRVVKDLEDATYGRCPIVIAGMGLIKELKAGADRNKKLMPQLWRRFRTNRMLLGYFRDEKAANVRRACEQYNITDTQVILLLEKNVNDFQTLREYVEDIHRHLIKPGREVNFRNVSALLKIY